MPEEVKTAADAVTAALAELAPPPETAEETTTEETPAEETTAEETTTEETTAEEIAEEIDAEETAEQKTARETAEAEANKGKTPEQIAAEKAAAQKEPTKKTLEDHLNDPISPQLKVETQERIRTLANTVRELEPIRAQHNELIQRITDTGMTAEHFGMSLQYATLIRSPNIEDKRRGYNILLGELKALAPLIGETLPGTNPLAGHQDLIDGVANKAITEAAAAELAKSRNQAKAATALQTQVQSQQQVDAEWLTAKKTAEGELNALGKQLQASDPQYAAKYAVIVPVLKQALPNLHPSLWTATFQAAWKDLKVSAPAAAPAAKKPAQQPMRANKQPAGGAAKQPTTMQEAIQASLNAGR